MGCRMLALKLTDGRATCKALEFKPTPALSVADLPPGTKLCVWDVGASGGILLLTPKCVKVWHSKSRRAFEVFVSPHCLRWELHSGLVQAVAVRPALSVADLPPGTKLC